VPATGEHHGIARFIRTHKCSPNDLHAHPDVLTGELPSARAIMPEPYAHREVFPANGVMHEGQMVPMTEH